MSELAPAFDAPLQACPLCGSSEVRAYDRDYRGIAISRCGACGVRFMNPQYTDAYLAAYYASYIQEGAERPERTAARLAQKTANIALVERVAAGGERGERGERGGASDVRGGRLLSIGCGDGIELQVATRRGWRAEGYDVDPATTARVAARTGAPVYSGDLFALPLEPNTYDCVYMDQVLEHPKNPGDFLRLAHRLLRPRGVLYLGVPNIGSLASTVKTMLGRVGLKRRRGKHYDTFHHLFYYSPATLPRLLETRYGYRVERVRGDPKPRAAPSSATAWWDDVVRRVPQLDSSFAIIARPVK